MVFVILYYMVHLVTMGAIIIFFGAKYSPLLMYE